MDEVNAFWPYYLSHHRHRANRAMHDIADILVIGWFACGLATSRPPLVAVGVGLGYAIVFASHFLIEHNTPLTLGHPFLAGVSNWRMFALMVGGRLDREFERHRLVQYGDAPWGPAAIRSRVLRATKRVVGGR